MSESKSQILLVSHTPTDKVPYHYIFPFYINALRKSGASVVVAISGEDPSALKKLYDCSDGVLLSGGGDIDPIHYGGDRQHKNVYGVSQDRDKTELELIDIAIKGTKPILAICRGMQLLNIARKGTLHIDISDNTDISHRHAEDEGVEHHVKVTDKGKILTKLNLPTMSVVSWHHQAVDKLGEGLTPVAFADDGTIEACELDCHSWCLGVQWHPEINFDKDKDQQTIFKAFVNQCKK